MKITVLAHLVMRANTLVEADTLRDALWGDEPPDSAVNIVQSYVSHLRRALGRERIAGLVSVFEPFFRGELPAEFAEAAADIAHTDDLVPGADAARLALRLVTTAFTTGFYPLDVVRVLRFLPHLRVKQDAVPGMTIPVWYTAQKPGFYDLVCAELCGWGHYKMKGRLTVQNEDDFNRWLEELRVNQESEK